MRDTTTPRSLHIVAIPRGRRAQPTRIGADANPAQIQPIGIPTRHHGRIGLQVSVAVALTGRDQQTEGCPIELEPAFPVQPARVLGGPKAVLGIGVFVLALGIVEEGEQLHDPQVSPDGASDMQPMAKNARPMWETVVPGPVESELVANLAQQIAIDDADRLHRTGPICREAGCLKWEPVDADLQINEVLRGDFLDATQHIP